MARILNVITAVSRMGGTNTKLRALMKGSKHKHYLYHPGYTSNKEIIEKEIPFFDTIGVKAYYGIFNRNIFAHAYRIHRIINENDIEIVHFYFNFEHLLLPLLKLWNPKVVFVRSIVGYDKPLVWWRQKLMNFIVGKTDNFVFISHYIKDLYETIYPSLKQKHTKVIYNGAVNIKEPLVTLNDKWKIVNVSVLEPRKNLDVLIEAMNIIRKRYQRPDVELFVVGDGTERKKLEKLIGDFNLDKQVHLVGYSSEVADYLDECSIYVHPATTEGFGIAVVEAMQMGCACVVADKGALPELVKDGVNGYTVDAYDAGTWAEKIVYLLEHNEERIKMGNVSKERALKDFSLEAFINNHDDYYDEILNH